MKDVLEHVLADFAIGCARVCMHVYIPFNLSDIYIYIYIYIYIPDIYFFVSRSGAERDGYAVAYNHILLLLLLFLFVVVSPVYL